MAIFKRFIQRYCDIERRTCTVLGATVNEGRLIFFSVGILVLIASALFIQPSHRYLASLTQVWQISQEERIIRDRFRAAHNWVGYFVGSHQNPAVRTTLAQFDLGCFGWHDGPIGNTLTCKYVSTMLAQDWMPNFPTQVQPIISAGGSIGSDPDFGGYIMDPGNVAWQNYVVDTLIPWVVQHGADGLFLDTFGFVDLPAYAGYRDRAVTLLARIRQSHPTYFYIMNEGDTLFPAAATYVDGLVFQNFRLNVAGNPWSPFPYPGQSDAITRVANSGVRIFTLEAPQPGNAANARLAFDTACALGFTGGFESIHDPLTVVTLPLTTPCPAPTALRPGTVTTGLLLDPGVRELRSLLGIEPHFFAAPAIPPTRVAPTPRPAIARAVVRDVPTQKPAPGVTAPKTPLPAPAPATPRLSLPPVSFSPFAAFRSLVLKLFGTNALVTTPRWPPVEIFFAP